MTDGDRLVVDTVDLRRRTGTRREIRTTARLSGLRVRDAEVDEGEIDLDLVVEAVTEGVVVTGTLSGRWVAPCRRCLDRVERPLSVDLHEVFEVHPSEGETWPLGDDGIDLAPPVREAALLALPLAPLCREDCVGPAPERFPTQVAVEGDPGPVTDPRWAALDELTFEDEGSGAD